MMDELARRRGPWIPAIHQALFAGVAEGAFPGGVCAVYHRGERVHLSAAGEAQRVPASIPMTADTAFDLASLTKVLATTALVAAYVGRGQVELDELVIKHLPAFARGGGQKAHVTVRDLLAHRSGLPAWRTYFTLAQADAGSAPLYAGNRAPGPVHRARTLVAQAALAEPLEHAIGERAVYSDVGFINLGLWLEAVAGAPLDVLVERELYRPLGLGSLHFRPLGSRLLPQVPLAATGLRRPREPAPGQESLYAGGPEAAPVPGEVDDDNAFALGGVAGHAGLFGTADDVARFSAKVLEDLEGAHRIAPREVWEALATRDPTPGSTRALGWDTPSAEGSSAGALLGKKGPLGAIGHLGFTGTSLWLDRDRQLAVALLTNRVHPTRASEGIRAFRPRFHDAAVRAIDARG